MSFQINMPPTLVAKLAKAEGDEMSELEMGKPKREDWKKLKELEEARKAGTAPAMKDEEGKDINPHIPQYIMQAPWYYASMQPTLRHQRVQDDPETGLARMNDWYKKGVKEGPVATKFRKGACENCGAMTHKRKDCLERPRKISAKFTGENLAPDEYINPNLSFDYDGKRDRWNGYDTTEHQQIAEEYAKIDEAKRQLKTQRLDHAVRDGEPIETQGDLPEKGGDSEEEGDEDKYADDVDMPGQKFETKQRITVRNLRIREDTAKYLYNLDPNSAYYDPKTRSMRENPFRNTGKDEAETTFGGDNFVRWSGDAHNMAERQLFAWEAYEKGNEAHLQADPTKLELLAREFKRKKEVFKDSQKQSIMEKYGGEEHLEAPSKELVLAQSEEYVEYSRHGTVLKGQERAKIKSRYEEDVYINNHTSVWGSFWNDGQWGFQCCHSLIKESYCTGSAGKEAARGMVPEITEEAASRLAEAHTADVTSSHQGAPPAAAVGRSPEKVHKETSEKKRKKKKREKKKKHKREKRKKKKKRRHSSSSSSSSSSESDSEDEEAAREKRIQQAMKRQEEKDKEMEKILAMDERKRPYNIKYDFSAPTDEEMEAFRRKRLRTDDPMANFL